MIRIAIAAALAAVALACGGGQPDSILDRGPRHPDAEGVVLDVSPERITLDGDRGFPIDARVESFTTGDHTPTPLVRWKGRFVHIGLDDDQEAIWIAGIGVVVDGDTPTVMYTGVFESVSRGRAVFRDGTVLRLADGVQPPGRGASALATIDPSARRVTALREQ